MARESRRQGKKERAGRRDFQRDNSTVQTGLIEAQVLHGCLHIEASGRVSGEGLSESLLW